ncbi:MAG: transcriptional repressor, partial [Oscillospiraceae bacterium]|nr:transcriptional repressor [Oscillospiraceae bacterium]
MPGGYIMNTRLKYKTKQREILIEYLEKFQGKHITASDVYEYFRSQGESIGQSTIYRQLESL